MKALPPPTCVSGKSCVKMDVSGREAAGETETEMADKRNEDAPLWMVFVGGCLLAAAFLLLILWPVIVG